MKSLYKDFEPIGKEWLFDLDRYNEVPFQRKTTGTRWSISEIYEILGRGTLDFHLVKLEEAIHKPQSGNKTWAGKLTFFRKNFGNKKLIYINIDYRGRGLRQWLRDFFPIFLTMIVSYNQNVYFLPSVH